MKRRRRCIERRAIAVTLRGVVLAMFLLLIAACDRPAPPLSHGVYVWQRVWDSALREAVVASPGFASSLRVLALQTGSVRSVVPDVDWELLQKTGLPVTAVVRIEGASPLGPEHTDAFLAQLREIGERLRDRGFRRFDLEIDHDCATAQLGAYARLLARIRADVAGIDTLTITALPAWRDAAELDAVLAQVDASVLQVHAVSDPAQGLFDGARAQGWVADWSRRSGTKPFLVALPAYGARLKLDADGTVVAVESEQPLSRRSANAREIAVDPRAIATWLTQLRAQRYANLAGIVWFRLPRDGDERAWAPRTLRAVISGAPLLAHLRVAAQTRDNGAIDVFLHSDGSIDAPLPAVLAVDGSCTAGDGLNGYRLVRDTHWRFERESDDRLRAGSSRLAGWLRCAEAAAVRVRAP